MNATVLLLLVLGFYGSVCSDQAPEDVKGRDLEEEEEENVDSTFSSFAENLRGTFTLDRANDGSALPGSEGESQPLIHTGLVYGEFCHETSTSTPETSGQAASESSTPEGPESGTENKGRRDNTESPSGALLIGTALSYAGSLLSSGIWEAGRIAGSAGLYTVNYVYENAPAVGTSIANATSSTMQYVYDSVPAVKDTIADATSATINYVWDATPAVTSAVLDGACYALEGATSLVSDGLGAVSDSLGIVRLVVPI
ncbi:signal peptide-containing protein [Theileria equi strain WA]|uniref:Signal peptide-containing protein n=1 Tax=Theileria equi strain WA TaxID=1537102 RepID=L0AYN1_THEEQ|nr:signal peptide-containing protein [Theileria equi strain WA]AFZ79989.1 signal peptide-containing protein [Theileria equi strain WA]|eukprot:XP_004829655.1 signal peptide-containing protein [Theileria equi strain WA]